MNSKTIVFPLIVALAIAAGACTLKQSPPSTTLPPSNERQIKPPSTEEIEAVTTKEISLVQVDPPPVLNTFDASSIVQDPSGCTWLVPNGNGEAVLQPSDQGFVLWTYSPFGFGLLGDGTGGLTWTFNAPPPGVGETDQRHLEVSDITRDGNKVILTIEETHYTEDAVDGCTENYTVTFTFSDPQVLDFLSAMLYDGSGGVKLENPELDISDGEVSLAGQLTGATAGRAFHIWVEVSGVETAYALAEILPQPDGTFLVKVFLDIPSNTFVILQVSSNGVTIASTSGDAPGD